MAERLGLGGQVRELKIGASFRPQRSGRNPSGQGQQTFTTIRYDFKPASVDPSQMGSLTVGENKQVSVSVPHTDGMSKTNYG